jgi:predicted glycosyltransferase
MDVVISGGGTMTREAAIMGVPSYSFFRGRDGMVDEALAKAGQLVLLTKPEEAAERLRVVRRHGDVTRPDPAALVSFISDAIIAAAGR